MDVGIGLPATIPGVEGAQVIEWARRAEARGFSSLGALDRVGSADVAFERAARHADGWIMGGGGPDQFSQGAEKLRAAWEAAGRDGRPRTMALGYFALGDGAREAADSYLRDYYEFLGDVADMI